jgi:hypothetical protein
MTPLSLRGGGANSKTYSLYDVLVIERTTSAVSLTGKTWNSIFCLSVNRGHLFTLTE